MHDKLYVYVPRQHQSESYINDNYYNHAHKYKITQTPNISTGIGILTQRPTCRVSQIILILLLVTLLVMQVE